MKTLNLQDIKNGALVQSVKKVTVEFVLNGEKQKAEITMKSLPYAQTEKFYKRLEKVSEDKTLIAEWLALALVDEHGQTLFTVEDIVQYFTMPLMMAVFNEVVALDNIPSDKLDEQGKSSSQKTKN